MKYDYNKWLENHNKCVGLIRRICDLNTKYDINRCSAAMAVMNFSMQDIEDYFKSGKHTSAELCFLIRNVDVIIISILDLNRDLLGVGRKKQDEVIKKCFTHPKIIHDFRTLRSLILAHPVDTHYVNDKGEIETVFLENIRPVSKWDAFMKLGEHDYTLRMCNPDTRSSHFKPLRIDEDIVPVINEIVDGIDILSQKLRASIIQYENELKNTLLNVKHDDLKSYILSLDRELKKRYPSCVEDDKFDNGTIRHDSIIYDCLMYVEASFAEQTQERFNVFLEYIESELHKIEIDLQSMNYDVSENSYFKLCDNKGFAPKEHYAKEKMSYLHYSNSTSFTWDDVPASTDSNVLWGVQQFKVLIPYIQQYMPVDTNVSDKELYCEYVAAQYLSNIVKDV